MFIRLDIVSIPCMCVIEEDGVCADLQLGLWQTCFTAGVKCVIVVGRRCKVIVCFCVCQRVWGCWCVSACGCGWIWSFQGDFNFYYCLPLLLDVSSEVNVCLICPHVGITFLSFLVLVPLTAFFFPPSSISSHQLLSSPFYTSISEAD